MLRHERVKQAIKREVSLIIANELMDPRMGFVTITAVDLSPDMRYAKVSYSVMGSVEQHKQTKGALESALGLIRTLVAERVQLRFAPEISFHEDLSTEYSAHMQEVFEKLKDLDGPQKRKKEE
ncbi:MAG TPA: 30S ribosome-binding factor RbfA [Candidatus Omnitrophota bacterium]|nr:30S ribosome-binding factor RbfA [Candidatus Omnitrophota bacterium]